MLALMDGTQRPFNLLISSTSIIRPNLFTFRTSTATGDNFLSHFFSNIIPDGLSYVRSILFYLMALTPGDRSVLV